MIIESPKDDLVYIDVAGLLDTQGDLLEFINQFTIKRIFNLAKHVRILTPMTMQQIKDQRGQLVREQMDVI